MHQPHCNNHIIVHQPAVGKNFAQPDHGVAQYYPYCMEAICFIRIVRILAQAYVSHRYCNSNQKFGEEWRCLVYSNLSDRTPKSLHFICLLISSA